MKSRQIQLTEGNILKTLLLFSIPMIVGNLLQQIYNIADTIIVGRYIGADALMTFIHSVIIGLCMGSGAVYSIFFGADEKDRLKESIWVSFLFSGSIFYHKYYFGFMVRDWT